MYTLLFNFFTLVFFLFVLLFCSFFHYFSLFLSSSLSVLVKQLIPFQAHGGIEGAEALRLLSLSLSSSLLQLLLGDPLPLPAQRQV